MRQQADFRRTQNVVYDSVVCVLFVVVFAAVVAVAFTAAAAAALAAVSVATAVSVLYTPLLLLASCSLVCASFLII